MSPRTPNVSHLLQELQNALMRFEQQPVQFTYSKETAMMKWLDFLREDLKQNEKRIAQEVACTIFNTISPKASILFASTLPVSAISYNGVPRLIAKQNSIAMSSRNHRWTVEEIRNRQAGGWMCEGFISTYSCKGRMPAEQETEQGYEEPQKLLHYGVTDSSQNIGLHVSHIWNMRSLVKLPENSHPRNNHVIRISIQRGICSTQPL